MADDDKPIDDNIVQLPLGKGKRRRPSSIDLLPKDIREALSDAISEGRMSVDDLLGLLHDKGAGHVSRSAVGRYKVREERAMGEIMRTQRMAEAYIKEAAKDPNGNVSRLLGQMVQSKIFQRLMTMTEAQAEKLDPKDLAFLANMAKSVAQGDKISAEREGMIRDRAIKAERAKQESALAKAEKKGDINKEAAEQARRILGFAT